KAGRVGGGDVLTDDAQPGMGLEEPGHSLAIEAALGAVLAVKVIGAAEAVGLAVDAEHQALVLHGAEDLAADPFVHGHAVLGIGGAVRGIVFAGLQEAGAG